MRKTGLADESSQPLDFIDGLRGIAILMVMATHWSYLFQNERIDTGVWVNYRVLFSLSTLGVTLFFLVSAFTLFRSSRLRFLQERSPIRNFYIRRFFRIIPLWWCAVIATALVRYTPLRDHLCCLLLIFPFVKGEHIAGFGWTLFVEETFYLLLPFLIFRLVSFWQCLLFLFLLSLVQFLYVSLLYNDVNLAVRLNSFLYPLHHWYKFAGGILLLCLWNNSRVREWIQRGKNAFPLMIFALIFILIWYGRSLIPSPLWVEERFSFLAGPRPEFDGDSWREAPGLV